MLTQFEFIGYSNGIQTNSVAEVESSSPKNDCF